MMAAHHKEAVNVRPEDPLPSIFSKAFAIRIPTQDKHSAANLKIVDLNIMKLKFLPIYLLQQH